MTEPPKKIATLRDMAAMLDITGGSICRLIGRDPQGYPDQAVILVRGRGATVEVLRLMDRAEGIERVHDIGDPR